MELALIPYGAAPCGGCFLLSTYGSERICYLVSITASPRLPRANRAYSLPRQSLTCSHYLAGWVIALVLR